MYYSRRQQGTYIAATVISIIVVAIFLYFLVTYRKPPERIRILDRWWVTSTAVKWDEQKTRIVTTIEETCSGYGENRSCTSYPVTSIEHYTVTHTRCTARANGRELPVTYPEPACQLRSEDYLRHTKDFRLQYENVEAEVKETRFKGILWSDLPPGFDRAVVTNLFGHITSLAEE